MKKIMPDNYDAPSILITFVIKLFDRSLTKSLKGVWKEFDRSLILGPVVNSLVIVCHYVIWQEYCGAQWTKPVKIILFPMTRNIFTKRKIYRALWRGAQYRRGMAFLSLFAPYRGKRQGNSEHIGWIQRYRLKTTYWNIQ